MIVVLLVVIMSTAVATVAIHSATSEVRASGHMRRSLETKNISESAITAAMALVDEIQPKTLLEAIQRSDNQPTVTYEPDLANGQRAYNILMKDFQNVQGVTSTPLNEDNMASNATGNSSNILNSGNAFEHDFSVDVTDYRRFRKKMVGERVDGLGSFYYIYASFTARGRTRVKSSVAPNGDVTLENDPRALNESASDARANVVAGPVP